MKLCGYHPVSNRYASYPATRFSGKQALNFSDAEKEAITQKIVLPFRTIGSSHIKNLVLVNTQKLDQAWQINCPGTYVGTGCTRDGIKGRYNHYLEVFPRLLTEKNIVVSAPKFIVSEKFAGPNPGLRASINDGRHRFSVLRDLGFQSIPIATSDKGVELLKKYGLFEKLLDREEFDY